MNGWPMNVSLQILLYGNKELFSLALLTHNIFRSPCELFYRRYRCVYYDICFPPIFTANSYLYRDRFIVATHFQLYEFGAETQSNKSKGKKVNGLKVESILCTFYLFCVQIKAGFRCKKCSTESEIDR